MNDNARPTRISLPPAVTVLLAFACATIFIAGIYFASSLLGPLLLGWLIVIICLPVATPIVRAGAPRWVGSLAVVILAFLLLLVMGFLMLYAATRFADMVPEVAVELRRTATQIIDWLHRSGWDAEASSAISSFLEPSYILSWVSYLSNMALTILIAFFFVICYIIFIAADTARISRAEELYGTSSRPSLTAFGKYNRGVRRYFVVNAIFGGIVAVIDGAALWMLDIPGPAVWAILAFVTNFVPNVGFFLGMAPPTLLAFVVGGWPLALIVVAIYCCVNVLLQVLIQPKFISDAVNLNLTLSFFSVVFWTFILGPIGAILSVPLTLAVRALVLDIDPHTRWLRWLSGDEIRETDSVPAVTETP